MCIGTYDVLRFKNYDEWTYCMLVRNKETAKHTDLEDEFLGGGAWGFSPRQIFFALLVYYFTDRRNHGLVEQLSSCQCEF